MLVATDLATDTRVLREASTLAGAGHAVHVVCRELPPDYRPPPGITVSSVSARSVFREEASARPPTRRLRAPQRLARWVLLPQHRNQVFRRWARGALADARGRDFDVVHAHDYTALGPAAQLARERGVPLVYDAHEFWSGRPRHGRPTPLQGWYERRREARLGSEAAVVVTVGDGVAHALRDAFGWQRVVVVRNAFPMSARPAHLMPAEGARAPKGLVYAGRLARYRELETIAEASTRVSLPITLVGPADDTWLAGFDPGDCLVRRALSVDEVTALLEDAGLALVTHSDKWRNHQLALPNKLFHAVRSGVPVVATDVGELATAVRRHRLGTLYRPGDAASLVAAIEQARADYPALAANVRAAAGELSWERDEAVLLDSYAGFARAAQPPGRRVVMLVRNGVRNDSRVRKSAVALADAGYDVTVLGTASAGGAEAFVLDGVPVRLVQVPAGRRPGRVEALRALVSRDGGWRRLNPWLADLDRAWRPLLTELAPDVVHAHDLHPMPAAAGYVRERRAAGHPARWVYDAHEDAEMAADRGARGPRGWLRRRMVGAMLRELVPQADAVLTVSDELAADLQVRHSLRRRPAVVLNAPVTRDERVPGAEPGTAACPSVRAAAGLAADVPLLVYVGGLSPARGLFTVVTALGCLSGVHLVLVAREGDPDLRALQDLAEALGVLDRLHVAPFVAPSLVTQYLRDADAAVVANLHHPNHEVSLNTKYLEYVQARVPLVVSDVRTMAAFTRRYGWGEVFRAGDADAFASAARTVLARREVYTAAYAEHADVLAALTWEHSAERLVAAYDDLRAAPLPRDAGPAVAS